ncbi:MAG: hypothetical protein NC225_01040 [Clostridium sp.]|nr:hypothetical protein [Clostridium sp.]MCM1459318.1 hypothetical protein [Bacteroides sp.]
MKKRYILTACILICTLVLTACGGDKGTKSSAALYETGMELAISVSELAKDEQYIDTVPISLSSEELLEKVVKDMDYSKPEHVYRIKNLDEVIPAAMVLVQEVNVDKCSETVKKHFEAGFINQIAGYIVSQKTGANMVAVRSFFIEQTSFIDTSVKDYEVYIYTYKDAYPIMVCFVPGKDGTVIASAGFLFVDDYIGADDKKFSEDYTLTMLNIKLEEVFK